ncbi:alpha/beta fold hydrolase [Geodermatophilus sp. URMC 62]|uniref:alpha/beta fold hydrolase n=1 Tax=Geodermatophilus sp. URMC 62 TaxID=3423414 RepID=UPI00406C56F2
MQHDVLLAGSAELTLAHTAHDRPTVLFVNAVGMSSQILAPVAAAFDRAGMGLVTWELRGSPGPTPNPVDSRLDDHVADGLRVLNRLGVGAMHVAGWCTGAPVAALLAGRLGERALSFTSVDGAFLFGGVPGGPLGNAMWAMCGEIVADTSRAEHFEPITRPRVQSAAVMGLDGGSPLFAQVTLPYRRGVEGLLRYAHAIRAACPPDPGRTLREIRCPALFTARRDDLMVSHRNAQQAARLVAGARFRLYESGGHYGLFQDPDTVAELAGFMRSAVGCVPVRS